MEKIKLFDTVAIINPVLIERLTLVEPDYTSIKTYQPDKWEPLLKCTNEQKTVSI
jgi:hypothetical protein